MQIKPLKLRGTYQIVLSPIADNRGFFMRTYDLNRFNHYGLNEVWVQENHSRSQEKGIIRGLHFQFPPYTETKLVRCIKGRILDVFVDLRKDSETFGHWDGIELSAENTKMVYIPRGFAHGFCTLTEESEVLYKVDNFYSPEFEGGIVWNDKDIGIEWGVENPVLSEKDEKNLAFSEFIEKYHCIDQ